MNLYLSISALIILIILPAFHGRPEVSGKNTRNVQISSSTGVTTCDDLSCPAGTVKCIKYKHTTPDLKQIIYERKCLNSAGEVKNQKTTNEPNPHPGSEYNNYSESAGSASNAFKCSNCNDKNGDDLFEKQREHDATLDKAFKRHHEEILRDFADFDKKFHF